MKLNTDNGILIQTESTPWKKGGEGNIYKIVSPASFTDKVVKVYHEFKQGKYDKCVYLKNNPIRVAKSHHQAIIGVDYLVFDAQKNFKGIVMKKAEGIDLYALCNMRLRPNIDAYYQKFDFKNPAYLDNRLKLCYNICSSVHAAHQQQRYILSDLKPQNILVDTKGFIYIIDIDNIGILENGRVKFPPEVTSPEISPPEHYTLKNLDEKFTLNWDRFSLAVVLFQVLFGLHPFIGTCLPPYQDCNDFPSKIRKQLFPFGPKKQYFKVVPAPLKKFLSIPIALQQLFIQAFTGYYNNRPSTVHWLSTIAGKAVPSLSKNPIQNGALSSISNQFSLNFQVPTYNIFNQDYHFKFQSFSQKPYFTDWISGLIYLITGRFYIYECKQQYNELYSHAAYTFKSRQTHCNLQINKLNKIKVRYKDKLLNLKNHIDGKLIHLSSQYQQFCQENDALMKEIETKYLDSEPQLLPKHVIPKHEENQAPIAAANTDTKPQISAEQKAVKRRKKERQIKKVSLQAVVQFKKLKQQNDFILKEYYKRLDHLKNAYHHEIRNLEPEIKQIIEQEKKWQEQAAYLITRINGS